MAGDKPCEYEKFVRHLAEAGLEGDDCRQLDALIHEGKAREVKEHLSSWIKVCARQLMDLVEDRKSRELVQISDPNDWLGRRADIEKMLLEGWGQHWLQLWGYIGQQRVANERFDVIVEALNYALGHTRKGKNLRKKLDALKAKKS